MPLNNDKNLLKTDDNNNNSNNNNNPVPKTDQSSFTFNCKTMGTFEKSYEEFLKKKENITSVKFENLYVHKKSKNINAEQQQIVARIRNILSDSTSIVNKIEFSSHTYIGMLIKSPIVLASSIEQIKFEGKNTHRVLEPDPSMGDLMELITKNSNIREFELDHRNYFYDATNYMIFLKRLGANIIPVIRAKLPSIQKRFENLKNLYAEYQKNHSSSEIQTKQLLSEIQILLNELTELPKVKNICSNGNVREDWAQKDLEFLRFRSQTNDLQREIDSISFSINSFIVDFYAESEELEGLKDFLDQLSESQKKHFLPKLFLIQGNSILRCVDSTESNNNNNNVSSSERQLKAFANFIIAANLELINQKPINTNDLDVTLSQLDIKPEASDAEEKELENKILRQKIIGQSIYFLLQAMGIQTRMTPKESPPKPSLLEHLIRLATNILLETCAAQNWNLELKDIFKLNSKQELPLNYTNYVKLLDFLSKLRTEIELLLNSLDTEIRRSLTTIDMTSNEGVCGCFLSKDKYNDIYEVTVKNLLLTQPTAEKVLISENQNLKTENLKLKQQQVEYEAKIKQLKGEQKEEQKNKKYKADSDKDNQQNSPLPHGPFWNSAPSADIPPLGTKLDAESNKPKKCNGDDTRENTSTKRKVEKNDTELENIDQNQNQAQP